MKMDGLNLAVFSSLSRYKRWQFLIAQWYKPPATYAQRYAKTRRYTKNFNAQNQ
jgi:hypothetical protein